ncbi:putative spermidine/putrescine transport system ATP-binding protein [Cohnella sp. OV330]|uniref:ABC transporter ATP-binding protein n=1 Tax=Cohnella sp. OV330 TaxID=1855288 RepID=UPI0008E8A01F|nr:ABC transporter ATP-binding protein [Cohnella sp. OV330]SFB48166.1 putative spermidine/putrescine transport system ATP-binding protein [Cohnella sp. OV330]
MNPILEIRQLHKSYGGQPALRGIDFSVSRGQIISVLGPSGCGKSTLLQLIAGLQQPDGGEVRLRGEAVSTASKLVPPEKRGINMVFQDYALWPHMSVYDNISYGLKRKKAASADIRTKVEELLRLLHLEPFAGRLPAQLSGGQQQRVAIARALATQPDLLLLDEPMSNLDMRLRIEMRTELSYLLRKLGTTVFHVTHDPEEAFAMADRLVIMRSGGIDQIDSPEACYRRPATASVASLLGAGNRIAGPIAEGEARSAIRLEGALVAGRTASDWSARRPSGPAIALFRPDAAAWETVNVGAADPSEEVAAGAEAGTAGSRTASAYNRLAARIAHSAFEGNRWRVLAETGTGEMLSLFHHEPLKAGTRGWLRFLVEETYLYPADAGSER